MSWEGTAAQAGGIEGGTGFPHSEAWQIFVVADNTAVNNKDDREIYIESIWGVIKSVITAEVGGLSTSHFTEAMNITLSDFPRVT